MPVSLAEFGTLFESLAAARVKTFPGKTLEATLRVYHAQVAKYPLPVVEQAIQRLIADPGRFFPTAGQLVAHCLEIEQTLIRRLNAQHQAAPLDPQDTCPTCRTAWFLAPYRLGTGHANGKRRLRLDGQAVVAVTEPGQATGQVVLRRRCQCPAAGAGWLTRDDPDYPTGEPAPSPPDRPSPSLLGGSDS